ncbi:hypothetical protein AVANS14531_02350 [Campylobacter sp. Cr9]|uniref:hypothetical protein n=1 Tax=unclassified Campylobacter TaxID=2593542 RepID=UPI001EFABC1F|nr:hypothetical protein [Campylobacter sp. RM5004]MBZ7985182.1 hypothetical protein [Campylobacter sp. Cr9]ULO01189.1 hypothetical protein AVANS_0554 [Campylobacter sp. RM5004]
MITKIKLALVNNDFDEFSNLASELEEKISSGWLNTLNQDELVELRALYVQVIEALLILKHKDLERLKKLKNSLHYIQ